MKVVHLEKHSSLKIFISKTITNPINKNEIIKYDI